MGILIIYFGNGQIHLGKEQNSWIDSLVPWWIKSVSIWPFVF